MEKQKGLSTEGGGSMEEMVVNGRDNPKRVGVKSHLGV